jgi:glycosyltransferase involved in cell wall biosynthesis
MISFIVPVYNVQIYLVRCIESIIAQTFHDWELILINDGSTDTSGEIADNYAAKDSRIKVIHKLNGGVSSARNTGIDEVRGEYICFIDSDDWIDPDFLEQFQTDKREADFYISGALYDVDNKVYSYKKYESFYSNNRRQIGEEYARQNLFDNGYPWGKLYKTKLVNENHLRFNINLSIHEDHLFVFEYLSLIQSIYITNSAGYHYLVFDDSGRRLTTKVIHCTKFLEISKLFEMKIELLRPNLELSALIVTKLHEKFVTGTRLVALKRLVLSQKIDINILKQERIFWINYMKNNRINASRMQNFMLFIVTRINYAPLIKMILRILVIFYYKFHIHKRFASCYKYLKTTSTVINQ